MNTVVINGSPRKKGNSASLAEYFTGKSHGTVTTFHLNDLSFKGCQGCMSCQKNGNGCVLKDDMQDVLAGMKEADVIVFASPVYYHSITGQFKLFLDRTFSLMFRKPDNSWGTHLPGDQKGLFIITQAAGEDFHNELTEFIAPIQNFMDFSSFEIVRGCSISTPSETLLRKDLLEKLDGVAIKYYEK